MQNLANTEQLSNSKGKSEFLGKGIASWKKEKLLLWRKEICSLRVCVEVKEETRQRREKKKHTKVEQRTETSAQSYKYRL